jgi:putative transposase
MKTYQQRLYPKLSQTKRFQTMTDEATALWNFLLQKSNEQYQKTGKGIVNWCELINLSKDFPTPHLHSHVKQNVSRRLARSFTLFFAKLKKGQRAKPPRFKKETESLTYPDGYGNGFNITGNKLWVSKIGNIPIVLHRPFGGNIKTLTVKRNRAGQWYAFLSSDITERFEREESKEAGIDVGIERYATFSDGTVIENPRFLFKHQKRIKRCQRDVGRKKKGSKNRQKARHRLAVAWQHYDDAKKDFLHKQTTSITSHYQTIAVEDLDIKKMLENDRPRGLHRSIAEASWGSFILLLGQKATMRSGQVIKVPAANTSQECSGCGRKVSKDLSIRRHDCPDCGLSVHRDLNAARNIAGRAGLARTYACGDKTSVAGITSAASPVVEARTITGAL